MNNGNSIFSFKREFGWSDVIALLALILSSIALYLQIKGNRAELSFTNDKLISTNFIDSDGRKKLFGFNRATIRNNGDKAVTLIGIEPHESLGLILLGIENTTALEPGNIKYRIFQVPDSVLAEKVIQDQKMIGSFADQGLEKLSMINKVINPGEVYTLNIGTVFDVFADSTKKYNSLVFSTNLIFSDGTRLLFGSAGNDFDQ